MALQCRDHAKMIRIADDHPRLRIAEEMASSPRW
jgi:hypothetical protein